MNRARTKAERTWSTSFFANMASWGARRFKVSFAGMPCDLGASSAEGRNSTSWTSQPGRHYQENTDSVTTTIGSSLCPLMSANSAVYDASPRPTALRPGARWRTRTGNSRTAAWPPRSPGPGPQPPATQVTPWNKRDAPHPRPAPQAADITRRPQQVDLAKHPPLACGSG